MIFKFRIEVYLYVHYTLSTLFEVCLMSNHHLDSATCCFVHGLIGFVGFSSFVLVFTGFSISFVFNLVGDSPKIQKPTDLYPRSSPGESKN